MLKEVDPRPSQEKVTQIFILLVFCELYPNYLINKYFFLFRRTRGCPEEDIPEMGELPPGACGLPHRRLVRGHARRQEPHQAAGGPVGRALGNTPFFFC